MKTLNTFPFYILLPLALFLSCCDKDEPGPPSTLKITILEPTEKTETGFTANWSIEGENLQSILIELSMTNEFSNVLAEVLVPDPGQTSQAIEGLHGATQYYYRLKITFSDGSNKTSNSQSVVTSYQSEDADVISSDGIHIAGELYYLNSNPSKSPAIILMGHFSINNMWKGEELFLKLVQLGYLCYVFNVRGHGASGAWDIISIQEIEDLEEFITEYAREDLLACYEYLKQHEKADSTRIGLMGGSMGANLSMIGNNWPGVKVSVGLTTSRLGLQDAGILHDVLFIASEQDSNQYVCFDEEAQFLYSGATDPKKIIIIPGDFHGLDMLVEPSLKQEISDWINARMGI